MTSVYFRHEGSAHYEHTRWYGRVPDKRTLGLTAGGGGIETRFIGTEEPSSQVHDKGDSGKDESLY